MYTLKTYKNERKYVPVSNLKFYNKRAKAKFYLNEKIKQTIFNIKSLTIDKEDVDKMILSENTKFILLNLKTLRKNDDEKVTIKADNYSNVILIYSILNTNWLINKDTLDLMSAEDVCEQISFLENEINSLESKDKKDYNLFSLSSNNAELLRYKKKKLEEYVIFKEQGIKKTKKKL